MILLYKGSSLRYRMSCGNLNETPLKHLLPTHLHTYRHTNKHIPIQAIKFLPAASYKECCFSCRDRRTAGQQRPHQQQQ